MNNFLKGFIALLLLLELACIAYWTDVLFFKETRPSDFEAGTAIFLTLVSLYSIWRNRGLIIIALKGKEDE